MNTDLKGLRRELDTPESAGSLFCGRQDCERGYPSVFAGITLVCEADRADAELLGYVARSSKDVTKTTGTVTQVPGTNTADIEADTVTRTYYRFDGGATLYDLRTRQTIWETNKAAHSAALTILAPGLASTQTPSNVARRIVGQLRKDTQTARWLTAQ